MGLTEGNEAETLKVIRVSNALLMRESHNIVRVSRGRRGVVTLSKSWVAERDRMCK